jgi:hypothetical protein
VGHGAAAAAAHAERHAHVDHDPPAHDATHRLASLVGGEHEDGATECRLVDQGCHPDGVVDGGVRLALPLFARDAPFAPLAHGPTCRAILAYSARAPPARFLA